MLLAAFKVFPENRLKGVASLHLKRKNEQQRVLGSANQFARLVRCLAVLERVLKYIRRRAKS